MIWSILGWPERVLVLCFIAFLVLKVVDGIVAAFEMIRALRAKRQTSRLYDLRSGRGISTNRH